MNAALVALIFGLVMATANYFVFYKNDEGRTRKSVLGGVLAAVFFAIVLPLIN